MFLAEFLLFAAVFLVALTLIGVFFSIEKQQVSEGYQKKKSALARYGRELFSRLAYVNTLLPLVGYRKRVNNQIRAAAAEGDYTFETFVATQEMYALIFAVLCYVVFSDSWILVLGGAIVGFYLPMARLGAAGKRRLKRIRADLPYMMDLMTLSVQAGADFIFAIQNIIENFPERPLREEMKMLLANVRAGNSRKDSLLKFKERVPLVEVSSLVGALIRADEMGTGLVEILRQQSAFAKTKRMQELREAAKRASTLMIIPLILFIFPCMFILILGPIAIKVFQTLAGTG